jgi:hypothetical protein
MLTLKNNGNLIEKTLKWTKKLQNNQRRPRNSKIIRRRIGKWKKRAAKGPRDTRGDD